MIPEVKITSDTASTILLYAFRYVLGRMSYAPSDWVDMFKCIYPQLEDKEKELVYTRLKEELEQAFRIEEINPKSLGWDCDRKLWHDFYKEYLKEK